MGDFRGWFGGGVWSWRKSPSPPGNLWRRSEPTQLADALDTFHLLAIFLALCLGLVTCLLREDRLGFDGGGRWSIGIGGRWSAPLVQKLCNEDCDDSLARFAALCRLQ